MDDIDRLQAHFDQRWPTRDASSARCRLQKAALMQTPERQRAALQTELDRLDELQRTCWPAATNGDVKAGHLALKIIAERVKLLGLDRSPEETRDRETIVIGGTEAEYVAALKAVLAPSQPTPG
jgi:hypothetical protein